jgi:predicted Rossmann-fold nucleotide-binding protein
MPTQSPEIAAHLEFRYSTIEDFMEAVTWLQLGYHKKPVGILNVNGPHAAAS